MKKNDDHTKNFLTEQNIYTPKDSVLNRKKSQRPKGLKGVLKIDEFRKLWVGQIFSQLADKFYIVLMVYLIAQYWVSSTPQGNEALAGVAAAMRMDFQTRAQKITLLATGIYVANTIPAVILGTIAGVGADRWPKRRVMVASNGLRALLVLFTPIFLIPGPDWIGLSWSWFGLVWFALYCIGMDCNWIKCVLSYWHQVPLDQGLVVHDEVAVLRNADRDPNRPQADRLRRHPRRHKKGDA